MKKQYVYKHMLQMRVVLVMCLQGCRDLLRVILEKSLLIPGQNAAVMPQVDALMKVTFQSTKERTSFPNLFSMPPYFHRYAHTPN